MVLSVSSRSVPRVVVDTNVLVAAARSRHGASFALLTALRARRFGLLLSVPLALEYEAVLKRPEHLWGRLPLQVDGLIDALCALAEPVHLQMRWRPQTRDPSDEMVLETALNGNADALVTFNVRDLQTAARSFHLPVHTPGAFLHVLQKEKSHG